MNNSHHLVSETTELQLNNKFLRLAIYKVFNGKCFYTGRSVSFANMHIDHIVPKSKGGENNINNYVLSCQDINLMKNGHFIHKDLVAIAVQTNISLFAPNVVNVYNDLIMNENILIEGYVELNFFLHKHKLQNDATFRQKCYTKLIPIKMKKEGQRRNKLFYKELELSRLFKNYKNSEKVISGASVKLPAMVGALKRKYKTSGIVHSSI